MQEILSKYGSLADIIRGDGADHIHFKESVLLLHGLRHLIVDGSSALQRGDYISVGNEKRQVGLKKELGDLVIFELLKCSF